MKKLLIVLVSVLAMSCAEVENDKITNEPSNPTAPTPITPITSNIEFRVSGNVVNADIRYTSPEEGTTFTTSYVPWQAKTRTPDQQFFVHVEAQGLGNGFSEETIQAQIIIDGRVFRESIVRGFLPKVTVSGTYVK